MGGSTAAAGASSSSFYSRNETPENKQYMQEFRVTPCRMFLQGACPFDNSMCFYTHSRVPQRRRPVFLNGVFNYLPIKCRFVLEEKVCPNVRTWRALLRL